MLFRSVMIALSVLFGFVSCGDDPEPVVKTDEEAKNDDDAGNTGNTGNTGDTGNTGNTGDTGNDDDAGNTGNTGDSGCATDNMGKSCATDTECGECMICTKGGKCVKGCTTNDDCTMYSGLRCNKKLARCTNVFASLQACGETKCPTGCCYGEKGLAGVKCLTTAEASKCGLCDQGDIYVPDDVPAKCVPSVCSTTTDNCSTLNAGSTKPPASCFKCKSGEYICEADKSTSGCSAGVIINAAKCIPAGQQCVAGVSECCSGMPCIQGYCY